LGYARVSSTDQDLAGQIEALKAVGCSKVYAEKVSGASTNGRSELAKLKAELQPGDTIIVVKLDRFARSIRDLLSMLDFIKAVGAEFKSLGDAWFDTSSPMGRFMITVVGGIAELEREMIRARCAEGIARAKAAGRHLGRPSKLTPKQAKLIADRRAEGQSYARIARDLGVAQATVWRAVRP
jgi:DNA invertase Pin-like site-specific DNA recombinase